MAEGSDARVARGAGWWARRGALALLVTVASLELGAFVLLSLGAGGLAPDAETPAAAAGDRLNAAEAPTDLSVEPYVLHPYLGFVWNRARPGREFNGLSISVEVNPYGFFGPAPTPAREGVFQVALTGGSMAAELYLRDGAALAEALSALPPARGKQVRVVSIALGGFKQPQQLAALAWFLARGDHFDAVLNLDGFNEVVLPFVENRRQGVSPDFPRLWRTHAARVVDAESAVLYGRIFETKGRLERLRERRAGWAWRHSRFLRLLAARSRARLTAEWLALEEKLRGRLASGERTAQESGPPYAYGDGMFGDFARLWGNASVQMWRLCRANDIAYFHFLQPNQYVEESKPLTARELEQAIFGPRSPYRRGAEGGYPALVAEGARLRERGVPFVDLTRVFAGTRETIYRDRCCHVNRRGDEILIGAMVEAMARHYAGAGYLGAEDAGAAAAPGSRASSGSIRSGG